LNRVAYAAGGRPPLEAPARYGSPPFHGVAREDGQDPLTGLAEAVDVDARLRDGLGGLGEHAGPVLAEIDGEILADRLHEAMYLLPTGTHAQPSPRVRMPPGATAVKAGGDRRAPPLHFRIRRRF